MVGLALTRPVFLLAGLLIVPAVIVFLRADRGESGKRKLASLILRCLLIAVLTCALSGPTASSGEPEVDVVFAVDHSDSVPEKTRIDALEVIAEAAAGGSGGPSRRVRTGLVVFGSEPSVESAPGSFTGATRVESYVEGSSTNIESAVLTSLAIMGSGRARRIILLSDGNETAGDALTAAKTARAAGAAVYPVLLSGEAEGNEIVVEGMTAPRTAAVSQTHELTLLVSSTERASARVSIFRDGEYLGEDDLDLSPGMNAFSYRAAVDEPGIHSYEAYVESFQDTFIRNNTGRAVVSVSGPARILYVHGDETPSFPLVSALEAQRFIVESVPDTSFPGSLRELLPFSAVILDNVPAYALSFGTMETIERYVRDAGGGLLAVGGDSSFGVGGYYKTPVERALPVDMDVTSALNIPSLSLVMVVDKSGSMGAAIAGGETKLDLVKQAVFSAVDVLNPFSTVGLLAFDADFEWTIPIVEAGRREEISEGLATLTSGGGTRLHQAMEEALRGLTAVPAAVKHMIVLSDGLTDDAEFETLARRIRERKITVTTVAVGEDSDKDLMRRIAATGGGRYYFTDDIRNVPQIFSSESLIVSRGLIVEEPFIPQTGEFHEILGGIDLRAVPGLDGFVLTYPKPGALEVLTAYQGNPLLSVWQYGLGRAAAFTSDLRGTWSRSWVEWDDFPLLTAQLLRWIGHPGETPSLSAEFTERGWSTGLTVDISEDDGTFGNLFDVKAVVISPDGRVKEYPVAQTAPGRYESEPEFSEEGIYFVTLYGERDGETLGPRTYGRAVPYPEEYRFTGPNVTLLTEIAELTGGAVIPLDADAVAGVIFAPAEAEAAGSSDLRPVFAALALILLVAEIAVRRLRLPEGAGSAVSRLLRKLRPAPGAPLPDLEESNRLIAEGRMAERARRPLAFWYRFEEESRKESRRLYLARRNRGKPT